MENGDKEEEMSEEKRNKAEEKVKRILEDLQPFEYRRYLQNRFARIGNPIKLKEEKEKLTFVRVLAK